MYGIADELFLAVAAGIIPFLVALTKRLAGGHLWPEFNQPTLAVIFGSVLGGIWWAAYPFLYAGASYEEPLLMAIVQGGFSGLAAVGVHALAKDVKQRQITHPGTRKIPR